MESMSFSGRTEDDKNFRGRPASGRTCVESHLGPHVYYREKLVSTSRSEPELPASLSVSTGNRSPHSSSEQESLPSSPNYTLSHLRCRSCGRSQGRNRSPPVPSTVNWSPVSGVATSDVERYPGNMTKSDRETVCHRWTTRFRVSAPQVAEYGAFFDNELINVQLTQRDLEELMVLVRREQETRLRRRVYPKENLGAVVEEQRQQIRVLSSELKRTQAALEEKTFLLDHEKGRSDALARQLRMLRKLRLSEKQEQQENLRNAECKLEKDLEKYVEAAHSQGLSFFDRTTESGTREADQPHDSFSAFTEGENFLTSFGAGEEHMIHVEEPSGVEEGWYDDSYTREVPSELYSGENGGSAGA
ncbi:conserved hypothetical protein [Neospora caninum Liverpool]|uniref:Uncharacterized protein n=1 Tax=Neospora caninum (strain Liverpool) TaxID=572307 RepID=F0VLV5_NEOCL|nr:conserved hypothetical protein [Neospora caninum Liverpool]CBZ54233.1 conserved hypothetical protein [Neospora caninum Liverpool]CEL68935.1 TPA: hypothetical protein BN1204_046650 [Neospora caninum Liverpool]|eukprot:XP_003884264.1 conserved hypothetical protein [Neospora caninum Liverpool]